MNRKEEKHKSSLVVKKTQPFVVMLSSDKAKGVLTHSILTQQID